MLLRKTIRAGRFDDGFDQRIPLTARRALAGPLVTDAAAFGTGVIGFYFCHFVIYGFNDQRSIMRTRGAIAHINS